MSSSGESLHCKGDVLLGLVPCWEILWKPRNKGAAICCLGRVPTLALVRPTAAGGKEVRWLGGGKAPSG